MATVQYNKTYMIQIGKDLKIRQNALPVLQNKEAALRAEARRIRQRIKKLHSEIEELLRGLQPLERLWAEFPDIVKVKDIILKQRNIAGIHVPVVEDVVFDVASFTAVAYPAWFLPGIEIVKRVIKLYALREAQVRTLERVEYARRKTTQKVNLYEKVQIPFFEEAIRKIKRFLDDQENLSKSAQKVIKKRMEVTV